MCDFEDGMASLRPGSQLVCCVHAGAHGGGLHGEHRGRRAGGGRKQGRSGRLLLAVPPPDRLCVLALRRPPGEPLYSCSMFTEGCQEVLAVMIGPLQLHDPGTPYLPTAGSRISLLAGFLGALSVRGGLSRGIHPWQAVNAIALGGELTWTCICSCL